VDLIITYIALVVPFLTIQLEFAAFRFAIEMRDDNEKQSELLSTIFALVLPVSVVLLGILLTISFFISIPYILLIVLNILSSVIVAIFLQFSRGIGKTKAFAIASIIAGIATTALSILFIVVLHRSASSILIATAISNIAATIYIAFAIRPRRQIRLKYVNFGMSKELLAYAVPLLPNNISWWILNVSDRTVISLVLGVAANGIYAIANKFAFITGTIFGIFNMSWAESASMHIDAPDRDEYFSKICNSAIIIYSCITALFIAVLPILFPYIVGHNYSEAYNYIPILAFGALAQGLVGLYSAIYIAKKKTRQIAHTSLLAAGINLVVNLSLVYFIGIYSAAISTLVAFLAMFVYRHFDVQKYAKITYDNNVFVKIIALFILTTTVYYWNNNIVSIISFVITVVSIILLNRKLITQSFDIVRVRLHQYVTKTGMK
jgi:O-antigen/teichoic acid export membrane protein